jgi:putative endonuclease
MWFKRNKDVNTNSAGAAAELWAEQFLTAQGLITRAKNYRCKAGEIDLIMSDGMTLVFVEVRLRSNRHFTSAAESVNLRKQQKIIKTAQHFLVEMNLLDKVACRFDVVALQQAGSNNLTTSTPDWIKDAFSA